MNTYLKENERGFNTFYNRYWINNISNGLSNIEIIISPACNLRCKYCYFQKHQKDLYPDNLIDNKLILENCLKIARWGIKNNFKGDLDLFSGEILAQQIGYDLLNALYELYSTTNIHPRAIMIPTNFTFICNNELTKKVEDIIEKFKSINIFLCLSASFDGKYLEENRPYVKNLDLPIEVIRDDVYYDKVFAFCKKHDYGFHPMVAAKGIEKWRDNFNWFISKIKEFGLEEDSLYLLEVRDADWSKNEYAEYKKLLRHIYYYLWDKSNHDKKEMIDTLLSQYGGFNILSSFLSRKNGISCSIQSYLHIRASDLKIVPCHRTSYPEFDIATMECDETGEITNNLIDVKHSELGYVIPQLKSSLMPGCIHCAISELCIGGCFGSQYETNKELFTPIPNVCLLFHIKIQTLIELFKETGIFYDMLCNVSKEQAEQLIGFDRNLNYRKEIEEKIV